MRAAWYETTGPAREVLRVGTLPDPVPGPGEVRVRVLASAVNPTDLYGRSGSRGAPGPGRPVVPHQDGAGRIDMVGEGVPHERVGELVWCAMTRRDGARGTAAELCVVRADHAVAAPPDADPEQLACIGIPWITAWAAATADGGTAPDEARGWTLVTGGAGAVGSFAVQAARMLGHAVVAVVSDGDGAAVAQRAGATATVIRGPAAAPAILAATGGGGVDRAIEVDLAENVDLLLEVVRPGGLVVAYGTGGRVASLPVSAALRRQLGIRFIYAYDLPEATRSAAAEAASALVAGGRLAFLPVAAYPLSDIAVAHEAAEAGGGGRRVVCVLP